MLCAVVAGAILVVGAWAGLDVPGRAQAGRIQVAVTEADIEAIVKAVGGDEVTTTHLFRGCILRPHLGVRAEAGERLASAEAIVWTGFFNESRAVHAWLEALPAGRRAALDPPTWVDVSHDVQRVNVPVSACDGYLELQFMPGDPFFWLNPENGAVIARNVAEGLARLRPARRSIFEANAATFARDLESRIQVWKRELELVSELRVFSAQCGWQNLSRIGGPHFMACRKNPGNLPRADALAAQLATLELDVILVDPNTPGEYAEAFRKATTAEVIEVPSSIADLAGATTYPALFDNLVEKLRAAAVARRGNAETRGSR
jgi:ABC-type Zn uptake system ZnuABC Zn-binding protein ZnuA